MFCCDLGFYLWEKKQTNKKISSYDKLYSKSVVARIQLAALNSNSRFFQEQTSASITILQIHLSQQIKCMENIIVDISSAVCLQLLIIRFCLAHGKTCPKYTLDFAGL